MKKEYDIDKLKIKSRGPRANKKTAKIQKTFRLDFEVMEWLHNQAEKENIGYQTYLNKLLKNLIKAEESKDVTKLSKNIEKMKKNLDDMMSISLFYQLNEGKKRNK